jgi:uncharacterized protein YndB with AHSA1/START domain
LWRALTDPALLAQWLLPVVDLELEPGAAFTFEAPPQPGWDGIVNCRVLEIEAHRVRRSHHWVSMAFTVAVIANIVVMSVGQGQAPAWVTYSPLLPLALLLFTGLYLFVLPYATRWRSSPKERQVT